ncbi:MAG: hypothetical protein BGN87_01750 [Rhizobiales bacterium 65-79]|nr:MAG: hypothetical protein BGN87_01750 [Rhizobiales bacterium 65-79]
MCAAARRNGARALAEDVAKSLLSASGITVPHGIRIAGHSDATEPALAGLKHPLVAKVLTREGAHKSDFGGVRIGLKSAKEVAGAIRQMSVAAQKAGIDAEGFLVEEQAEAQGVELVVGGLIDPRFGPCVMVGLGGIFTEIFADVAFRVCPITASDALEMLKELKGSRILTGARGRQPVDMDAVVSALVCFGGQQGVLMTLQNEVREIEMNPLIAGTKGAVAVDARVILAESPAVFPKVAPPIDPTAVLAAYRHLFRPRSIAVLGASENGKSPGNAIIRYSKKFGFAGKLIPVHPRAEQIEGLPTVSSLSNLEEAADFAYVAIGADAAVSALEQAQGKARFVQVMSSGFGEVEHGIEKERRLLAAAKAADFRLLGPNCLGVHSPRGGLTFVEDADPEPGTVGIISQSGGLAVDLISRGAERGLKFSAVTTLGNSADVKPVDLLEYHFCDPETQVIGLYLEDVKDGRRFVQRLVEHMGEKPVVLLVGGRTAAGGRAAASHTGSMAADTRLWDGIARQTGAVIADTLNEFIDILLLMQMRSGGKKRPTRNVVLFGNGGGTSVLAADAFARLGLETPTLSKPVLDRLLALDLPPGTGLNNPVDTPANTLLHQDGAVAGKILDILLKEQACDAIVLHINLPVFMKSVNRTVDVIGGLVREAVRVRRENVDAPRILLVLRSDGAEATENRRRADRLAALAAGIPVFDELPETAKALRGLAHWEACHYAR